MAQRGTGDVGLAVEVSTPEAPSGEALHTHRRLDPCHPQAIFGEITVNRLGYGHPGAPTVHPLDDQLQLPRRSFSYELQRRLMKAAVQGPFQEAIERVAEATGVVVPKRSAEQLVRETAQDVEAFYQGRIPPQEAETGPILVGSVDSKGIPMVKAEPAERVVRRGKGEKASKKKMAVVAAVFTQQPRVRTPEEVIESLFAAGPRPPEGTGERSPVRDRPEDKRVWASLTTGKAGVIRELRQEMARRDLARTKQPVVVTDGERALQRTVRRLLPGMPLVLDFQHALEKLWTAAYAFHEEGSPEAQAWVQERALRLLQGEVSQVVKGRRQSATKRKLLGQRRKAVEATAAYFARNRRFMRYHEALRQGWPKRC